MTIEMGEDDLHAHLASAWVKRDRPYGPFLVFGSAQSALSTDHMLTGSVSMKLMNLYNLLKFIQ